MIYENSDKILGLMGIVTGIEIIAAVIFMLFNFISEESTNCRTNRKLFKHDYDITLITIFLKKGN